MKFTKLELAALEGCYSVAEASINHKTHVLFASESDDKCLAIDVDKLSSPKTVWEHPGGTMSMVPIPGKDGEFLAIQKFYRLWDWEESQLVWVKHQADGSFAVSPLFTRPYIHRFDLLSRDGRLYLLVCCVAAHKSSLEDWSQPGIVYAALLPEGPEEEIRLEMLGDTFLKNHGYARVQWNGTECGFVTCESGGFIFTPPGKGQPEWGIEKILEGTFSDGDMVDIDGDGELEIATIEAFHGDKFRIYKKIGGSYQLVFQHPEVVNFYHVVQQGTLAGRKGFLGGGRGGKEQLFFVSWQPDTQEFKIHPIDAGQGPSNAIILNRPEGDCIFSANRNAGTAVVYKCKGFDE
ncbi:hypothetical protein U6B65_02115 [Oscillospiraceae bacterium MB08-C2-2]|nr:hypothetical protein U6B65_02115 [Oscillospiraceae bacterium MB08-C2-2]